MFKRCLVCHSPFPENEALEHFPNGQRVAFDPARGRLWAVCTVCRRWSLAPMEERWEALEELEKLVRDKARLMSQTDNIALFKAGPLDIVRVGHGQPHGRGLVAIREGTAGASTEVQQDLACGFRCGGRRDGGRLGHRRHEPSWECGFLWGNAPEVFTDAARWMRFGSTVWRGDAQCPRCGHAFRTLRFAERGGLYLLPGDSGGPAALSFRCPKCGNFREGGLHLSGGESTNALRRILAYDHFDGASERRVMSATRLIQEAGSAQDLTRIVVKDGRRLGDLQRTGAIALEIAANETFEQRLLELELGRAGSSLARGRRTRRHRGRRAHPAAGARKPTSEADRPVVSRARQHDLACVRRRRWATTVVVLATLVGGCAPESPGARDGLPRVVVSIAPIADLVERLVGPSARVETLLPPRASPATYEPSARQRASNADQVVLWVFIGGGLDAWAETFTSGSVPVHRVSDQVALRGAGSRAGSGDPHVWLDPVLVRDEVLPGIVAALERALPRATDEIRARATSIADSLGVLHREYEVGLADVRGAGLLTGHGGWRYLADRYGLVALGEAHEHPGPRAVGSTRRGAGGARTRGAGQHGLRRASDQPCIRRGAGPRAPGAGVAPGPTRWAEIREPRVLRNHALQPQRPTRGARRAPEASVSSDAAAAVAFDDVTFSYGRRTALRDVSFAVEPGSFTALIGPNGAGKSTALKLILGLVRPDAGRVRIFGGEPGRSGQPLGYVPQSLQIPAGFPITVEETVLMGRYGRLGLLRRPRAEDRRRVSEALERVGLGDALDTRFEDLSGGQRQRALIARALAGEPRLLLLDEPTVGLDPAAQARFYTLVCDLQHGRGLSLLCASHDLEVVSAHADRLVLIDGEVRADGSPASVLASDELAQAYAFPPPHEHPTVGEPA